MNKWYFRERWFAFDVQDQIKSTQVILNRSYAGLTKIDLGVKERTLCWCTYTEKSGIHSPI